MAQVTDENRDHLERRCPRLGGLVSFQYCRLFAGDRLPCWKVFECWWEHFDVSAYFKETLSEADFKKLVDTKPKPKIHSLIELIEKAKKNVDSKKSSQQ